MVQIVKYILISRDLESWVFKMKFLNKNCHWKEKQNIMNILEDETAKGKMGPGKVWLSVEMTKPSCWRELG